MSKPTKPAALQLEQIGEVAAQLDRLDRRLETLADEFQARLDSLADDVRSYVTEHDAWCYGFSQAVAGAAAVLSGFERYAGLNPRIGEDGGIEEAADRDGT